MRSLTGEQGTVLVLDARMGEKLRRPRLRSRGVQLLQQHLALPASGEVEQPSAGTGGVMRPRCLLQALGPQLLDPPLGTSQASVHGENIGVGGDLVEGSRRSIAQFSLTGHSRPQKIRHLVDVPAAY